jgi:hypothetical protein
MTQLKQNFGKLPDIRIGKNTVVEMQDAGMGAFSVFIYRKPIVFSTPGRNETVECTHSNVRESV